MPPKDRPVIAAVKHAPSRHAVDCRYVELELEARIWKSDLDTHADLLKHVWPIEIQAYVLN